MAFEPKTWANNPEGGTPITAEELNRIETGIESSVQQGDAVASPFVIAPQNSVHEGGELILQGAGDWNDVFLDAVQNVCRLFAGTFDVYVTRLTVNGADGIYDNANRVYSATSPPATVSRTLYAASSVATPASGFAEEFTQDGKSLDIKASDGTVSRIGGGTHATLAADQAVSVTAFTDLTGISVPMAANTGYMIEGAIAWTVAATTTGYRFGVAGPGLATANIVFDVNATATTWTTSTQVHNNTALTPSVAAATASPFAVTPNLVRFQGYVMNGATAGNLRLQGASELAGTAITVKRGTYMTVRAV